MNADDMLKYGHQTLMNALNRIQPEHADLKEACGSWSVKDLVIHLNASQLVLIDSIRQMHGETDLPNLDYMLNSGPDYNDKVVAEQQSKNYEEVLADYQAAYEESREQLAKVEEATRRQNGALAWYGDAYDLDDFIVFTIYAHKREHSGQIDIFADRMEQG